MMRLADVKKITVEPWWGIMTCRCRSRAQRCRVSAAQASNLECRKMLESIPRAANNWVHGGSGVGALGYAPGVWRSLRQRLRAS
jgi:hypothetical protein